MNIIRSLWVVVLMTCLQGSYAQKNKITYENDTIKIDGKPYALMTKKNVAPLRNDFSVRSLSNVELLYFKTELNKYSSYRGWMFGSSPYMYGNDELYYKAVFIATGSEANVRYQNAKGFAKMLVESNLIKENSIDPESEKRFILLNNGYTPKQEKAVATTSANQDATSAGTSTVAPVKSMSPIVITGNQIRRDGNVIGKFRQDTVVSAYAPKVLVLTVYSEAGEKAAEATVPLEKPQEWSVKLQSTGKTITVMYDEPGEREKLFRWLADKNYLAN